ncbi:MAG: glutamine--fructose-6-phosphate transaminase (isomerizing) [Acidimicrobiales bacterium]
MCGIIGVTGRQDALPLLLEGLARLEYRGYDSAGVALVTRGDDGPGAGEGPAGDGTAGDGRRAALRQGLPEKGLPEKGLPENGVPGQGLARRGRTWRARRAVGTKSVAELAQATHGAPAGASTGVGHTRWATHGRPSEENAHPHLDCTGELALVHNGIIENYLELGDELVASGHELTSETDTEVLAHLIEAELAAGATLAAAVAAVLRRVRGAFALAVVHASRPEVLVAARRVSPLILGRTGEASLVASDIPALLGRADELFVLEDDQLAELGPGWMEVTDGEGRAVQPRRITVSWDLEAAEKGGYPDFMAKEMHEQPRAIADTLLGRILADGTLHLDEDRLSDDELRAVDKVFVVACGSSFHAGLVAKHAVEHWARLPVDIDVASEFRYRDPVLDGHSLVVGVSQSGETIDTLQALRSARRQGAKSLVITNVVDSSMARESDAVLYTRAGPEIGVAATKTHLTQLVALDVLALYLALVRGLLYPEEVHPLLGHLGALPALVGSALEREPEVAAVARRLEGVEHFFFLGRNVGHAVALEGALKLKEISYLRAEGYPAGELKHGPIALIRPGTAVVAVATRTRLWEKVLSNVAEVRARGATVVVVANEGDDETAAQADEVLWVPSSPHELLAPVVDVVPLQLLAYHLAKAAGTDVDRPRNLAKTVTVE